jgi:hypothetical protein
MKPAAWHGFCDAIQKSVLTMMTQRLRSLFLALIVTAFGSQLWAQLDSSLAYCNLFYATSDHPDIIPFEDNCFVNFNYEVNDYPRVRVVGPLKHQADFFREYDWSLMFHLPPMTGKGLLTVEQPKDLSDEKPEMAPGKMALTLCDNRQRRYYGPNSHKVDWVAVEGKIKINEYIPQQEGWKHPELQAQCDVYLQQVIDGGEGPIATGPKVRLKCVLVVENKHD